MFKKGDVVKCINATDYHYPPTVGRIYEVIDLFDTESFLTKDALYPEFETIDFRHEDFLLVHRTYDKPIGNCNKFSDSGI